MNSLLYTFLWFSCSISISIVYRLSGYYFHFNGLLTSTSLFLQGFLVCCWMKKLPNKPNFKDVYFSGTILSQAFYIFLSNLSLQFVPIYVAIIFKSFVPFFNVLINSKIESNILTTVLNSIVLSIGVFLSIWNPGENVVVTSYFGILLCLLACFFNVLRFFVIKKYLNTIQETNKAVVVISDTYPLMSMLLTPLGVFSSFKQEWNALSVEYFIGITMVCTFLGLFLTIGELKVLQYNSVFFTTILEILKEVVLLIGSGLVENNTTLLNWMGFILVITSICSIHFENRQEETLELE